MPTMTETTVSAIQTAQSKITDAMKAFKEEQNSSIQQTQSGFGDKFKAKAGSWSCQGCYTNNLETCSKCVCCSQTNPKTAASKVDKPATDPPKHYNWGEQFKPKPGSWECKSCLLRNEATVLHCSACNIPKDPTTKKPTPAIVTNFGMDFYFGLPRETTTIIQPQTKTVSAPSTIAPLVTGSGDLGIFRFGVIPTLTEEVKVKPESIFFGDGANKFSFSAPLIEEKSCKENPNLTAIIYAARKIPTKTEGTLNISFSSNNENTKAKSQTDTPTDALVGKKSGFDFVYTSPKSVANSPHKQENESYPVAPLPDKVEVVTGEENEQELYGHPVKLYIFVSGEWKERGTGIVKILKHKKTNKLRVVMRRDKVFKVCLNHTLTQDMTYKLKDERAWVFAAYDFSEGELSLPKLFCLKFLNNELAMQFKTAVDIARETGKPVDMKAEPKATKPDQRDDDDVVIVSQIQANPEDRQKAKDLMLPENFYTYKHKEPCQGCRGCSEDSKSNNSQL